MKNCCWLIMGIVMLLGLSSTSYAKPGKEKSSNVRFSGKVKNKCTLTAEATGEMGIADLISKPDLLTTKPTEYSKGRAQRISAKCSGNGKLSVGSPVAVNANATKLKVLSKGSGIYSNEAGTGTPITTSTTGGISITFNGAKKTYYMHMYVWSSPAGTPIKPGNYVYQVVVSLTPL
jgi:type 1 fimbria pilin